MDLFAVPLAMAYIIIRLLHLGAVLGLAGAVVVENIALKPTLSTEDAHNLATIDRVAGLAALLTLVLGLGLWFGVGKPADFYSANPLFHAKIGLFVLLVAIALYPAWFFHKHRATDLIEIPVPRGVAVLLKLELALLLILPLLAFLMARGVGLPA